MAGKPRKIDLQLEKKLKEYQRAVSDTAEDIIFVTFPTKILEIQQRIDSTLAPDSPFYMSHAQSSTDVTVYPAPNTPSDPEPKKRKRSTDNGVAANGATVNDTEYARYPNLVMANQHISKLHVVLKQECEELADYVDKVKLWVNLNMPKIEDGDNFGVQIQEEVLQELHRSQQSAYNLRDNARRDYLDRAKICAKLIKYPNIQDYALALKEHDEKQLYCARQDLLDLRNIYAVLTDIIHKNIQKLRSPKGNNSSALY
ncbi:proteasome activator pa28 REG alpha/beta subunit [Neolentinus lepideus HHB14362 ss-1]|uniref:Proteasome activator pa28 REG alpha/beta subunit n=1 Tax=Neolentinus lepideus HHB14362 ss-1 TaxID=1314782 RepID=A0A165W694_9AGAM|nr:proteasome activator pa28 REG alpha/beta subunit [Neolentinus lepideus HHB14362 ss-1]